MYPSKPAAQSAAPAVPEPPIKRLGKMLSARLPEGEPAAQSADAEPTADDLKIFQRGYDLGRKEAQSAVDAKRYRWLRGPDVESVRYSRWKIEYWDGPNGWQPMQREAMDAAIDAALSQSAKDAT